MKGKCQAEECSAHYTKYGIRCFFLRKKNKYYMKMNKKKTYKHRYNYFIKSVTWRSHEVKKVFLNKIYLKMLIDQFNCRVPAVIEAPLFNFKLFFYSFKILDDVLGDFQLYIQYILQRSAICIFEKLSNNDGLVSSISVNQEIDNRDNL
jgi:hypothetical protein